MWAKLPMMIAIQVLSTLMGSELLKPVKVLSKGPSFHVAQIKDGFKMIQISNIRPYYYC